jgi:integrase/recombinase XerC
MTSLELMVASLALQGRADWVSQLDPQALRREALRAARDSDFEGL